MKHIRTIMEIIRLNEITYKKYYSLATGHKFAWKYFSLKKENFRKFKMLDP